MNEQINDNKIGMGGSNNGSDGSTNIDSNSSSSSWQNETQSELDQAEYEQAAYSPPGKKSLFNKNSLFFMGACVFAVLMMYAPRFMLLIVSACIRWRVSLVNGQCSVTK